MRAAAGRRKHVLSATYSRAGELDAPSHGMLGLRALFDTMAGLGISAPQLLEGTGLSERELTDARAMMSHRQKLAILRNVWTRTPDPAIGLRAGQAQRLSDFGVYGYALISCTDFGEAVAFGMKHIRLAGPVLEKRFRCEGDNAIFEGRDFLGLGTLLPVASEFWFSSIQTLINRVLEDCFRGRRMLLPYPAPPHAPMYEEIFGCPVRFGTDVIEWHFDAALLSQPLPNANPITRDICTGFCGRMIDALDKEQEPELVSAIRAECLSRRGDFPKADDLAERLGVSSRTLHRRLSAAGTSYQQVIDGLRQRLAVEYLENSTLSIEEIAFRTGFSDASNFRKAFKRWVGELPGRFRTRVTALAA